ncbi:MAG: YfaP family protein, partial [bacterium]
MANLTKSFHNSIIATILAFTTLVFYSCEKEPQLTNPNDEAQIELMVVSAKASSDSPKSKTLSFSSKHNYSKKQPFVRNIDILLRTIDRVTVSVINSSGVAVINERELTIVETEQGRFAEGTLSIPVNEPSETFRIDVKAFENENLVLAGARQIILTPGEIREEPVAVIIRPLGTGDIQITLTWNTATDQDLHVIDPTGFRIFFEDTLSPTGGELDFDDIDGFGPENIFWPPGGAPNGRYKVQVVYYSGSEVTDVTVVVRRSDAETRTFTGTLAVEKDTLDVTEFTFAGG